MDFFKDEEEIDFNDFVIDFNALSIDTTIKTTLTNECSGNPQDKDTDVEKSIEIHDQLRIHQEIVIVGVKNSKYNCYKGYIGYIKNIRQDKITVCLNAILDKNNIIFPIDHVRKLDS